MIDKMDTINEDIIIGYKIARDKFEAAERAYNKLNSYIEGLPGQSIKAIWDKELDEAYNKMVNARMCFESYRDAVICARKLYSILQDIEEYEQEMRK